MHKDEQRISLFWILQSNTFISPQESLKILTMNKNFAFPLTKEAQFKLET